MPTSWRAGNAQKGISAALVKGTSEALSNALRYYRDAACFEGKFKEELRDIFPEAFVKRESPCQWEITSGDERVFASLRAKGAGETLQRLKYIARDVRHVLLGDRAAWLRTLSRDDSDRSSDVERFLSDVREEKKQDHGNGAVNRSGDEELCEWCNQSVLKDRLGGRHHCRMIANFWCVECGNSWTTQRARYDLQANRLLGQDCEKCSTPDWPCPGQEVWSVVLSQQELSKLQQRREARSSADIHRAAWESGEAWAEERYSDVEDEQATYWNGDSGWQVAAWAEEEEKVVQWTEVTAPDDPTDLKARTDFHRPDLCEGCKRYGDCTGAFMEPFVLFYAARLLQEEWLTEELIEQEDDPQWNVTSDGWQLTSENLGAIELVPHVYAPPQEHAQSWWSSTPWSWSSPSSSNQHTPNSCEWEVVREHFRRGSR